MPGPNVAGDLPALSVIVRSAGRPALSAALASIAAQDYPAVDVVVVAAPGPAHPGLPDRCGAHPLRLVRSGVEEGPPGAANAGLDAATGDWISFLDEADVFLPGHLAGLMAARAAAPDAAVIHSYARAVLPDGRTLRFGQPHCLAQLYARNCIHLSSVVFRRALAEQGCRFDPDLPVHHEWDMLLQMAQLATFHFVLQETCQWNVGAGGHAAGDGVTEDDAVSAQCRERVHAKWASRRDALIDRVLPMVRSAAEWAQHGDYLAAEACCHDVLALSPNDPWALNLLASIQRDTGRGAEARATQELAVAVRPEDPALVFNLALLCRAQGDLERARRCCDRAVALDADFAPAKRLLAQLAR